jgi:hypothetical protein
LHADPPVTGREFPASLYAGTCGKVPALLATKLQEEFTPGESDLLCSREPKPTLLSATYCVSSREPAFACSDGDSGGLTRYNLNHVS